MTQEEYAQDLQKRYDAEILAGGSISISTIPTVAIELSNGDTYFFQEEEAENLLEGVPDYMNAEVFLLAMAQGW